MKPARSRYLMFVARWAILSGLAGVVFTILVWQQRSRVEIGGQRGLLLAAAILLSIAFILAPFVRRAFAGRVVKSPMRGSGKTLLQEMREQEGETVDSTSASELPATTSVASRIIVALYVVFATTLAVDLWLM